MRCQDEILSQTSRLARIANDRANAREVVLLFVAFVRNDSFCNFFCTVFFACSANLGIRSTAIPKQARARPIESWSCRGFPLSLFLDVMDCVLIRMAQMVIPPKNGLCQQWNLLALR